MEHYKFVKSIGKGAFGKVTLGIHKLTGKYVAIKSIEKENLKASAQKRPRAELRVGKNLPGF